jgi:hypothetical protein
MAASFLCSGMYFCSFRPLGLKLSRSETQYARTLKEKPQA